MAVMAQSLISVFVDDAAQTARLAEVPNAIWNSGGFGGASCSPGIGISTLTPNLDQSLFVSTCGPTAGQRNTGSWTLLDQFGNARNDQIGQLIGGPGFVNRKGNQAFTWDRAQALYTAGGAASSGGASGRSPQSTIRMIHAANLPTYAQKLADPSVDGKLTFPAFGAEMDTLAVGWIESLTTFEEDEAAATAESEGLVKRVKKALTPKKRTD